jgi:tRNA pseudouridine38-40 synthase
MKLFLCISYDGSDYCGYQAQAKGRTVQQTLNAATEDLFGHPCDITGCSRTDSGVHARMFCATVTAHGAESLETSVPVDRIPRALNVRLPDSLSVWHARWVPEDFHARYSVQSKEYEYHIYNGAHRSPFEQGRSWHVPTPIDDDTLRAMDMAAKGFVRTGDFTSCMAAGSTVEDPVRSVTHASVTREGDTVVFRVRADGFLYHMVRIMVGTLVEVGRGERKPESVPELFGGKRAEAGFLAPAQGLCLQEVYY